MTKLVVAVEKNCKNAIYNNLHNITRIQTKLFLLSKPQLVQISDKNTN